MKKNIKIVIVPFLGLLMFMLTGCPENLDDPNIEFDYWNQSEEEIFIICAINQDSIQCPDTLLSEINWMVDYPDLGVVLGAKSFKLKGFSPPACDTARIFIINMDTINKYGWNEVRDSYKILHRYDLNLNYLRKLDYNIIYPPTDLMRRYVNIYTPEYANE